MDLSVFNALIGTTDTQNPFGVMPTPDGTSTDENTIGKSDEFLQCLEKARLGNMNLSSDSLFTALRAKTQTTKLTKNLKSNLKAGTKVVKLRMEVKRPEAPKTEVVQPQTQIQQPVKTEQIVTPKQEIQPQKIDEEVVVEATDQLVAKAPEEINVQVKPTENLTPQLPEEIEISNDKPFEIKTAPKKEHQIENSSEIETTSLEKLTIEDNDIPVEINFKKTEIETNEPEQIIEKRPEKIELNDETFIPVIQVKQNDMPVRAEKQIAETEIQEDIVPTEIIPNLKIEKPQIQVFQKHETFVAPEKQTEIPQAKLPEQVDFVEKNYESTSELKMYSGFDLPEEQIIQQQQNLASILPEQTHAKISVSVKDYSKKETKTEVLPELKKAVKPVETTENNDFSENLFTPSDHKAKDSALAKNIFEKPNFNEGRQKQTENNFQPLFSLVQTEQTIADDISPLAFKSVSSIQNVSSTPMPTVAIGENAKEIKNPVKTQQPAPTQKYTPVNELADQIKVKITKALAQNTGKIDVSIATKELGKVHVVVETKEGQTTIKINASRPETLNLLQNDIAVLKQSLSDLGMNMENGTFFFNYKQENQQKDSENKNLAHDLHSNSTEEISEVSEVQNEYITKDRVNVRI